MAFLFHSKSTDLQAENDSYQVVVLSCLNKWNKTENWNKNKFISVSDVCTCERKQLKQLLTCFRLINIFDIYSYCWLKSETKTFHFSQPLIKLFYISFCCSFLSLVQTSNQVIWCSTACWLNNIVLCISLAMHQLHLDSLFLLSDRFHFINSSTEWSSHWIIIFLMFASSQAD